MIPCINQPTTSSAASFHTLFQFPFFLFCYHRVTTQHHNAQKDKRSNNQLSVTFTSLYIAYLHLYPTKFITPLYSRTFTHTKMFKLEFAYTLLLCCAPVESGPSGDITITRLNAVPAQDTTNQIQRANLHSIPQEAQMTYEDDGHEHKARVQQGVVKLLEKRKDSLQYHFQILIYPDQSERNFHNTSCLNTSRISKRSTKHRHVKMIPQT